MSSKILIILACVPLYVVNSFCDKYISSRDGNKNNVLYNGIKFLICSIILLPMALMDNAPKFAFGTVFCGVACGVMYAVSKTVMLKGYETTSVAFMTLCHSSGMIIPCILGHFLWTEKLTIISMCGIGITIIAILLLKDSKKSERPFGRIGVLYGAVIFLTSAGVMITQKVMGIYFADESIALYNFYSFFVPALILCLLIKPTGLKNRNKKQKTVIGICALGSAVSLVIIGFVMTTLASDVPSVILFPLFNGLGIITVCIGSIFVFKEKLNSKKVFGLIFGVLGLFLINI